MLGPYMEATWFHIFRPLVNCSRSWSRSLFSPNRPTFPPQLCFPSIYPAFFHSGFGELELNPGLFSIGLCFSDSPILIKALPCSFPTTPGHPMENGNAGVPDPREQRKLAVAKLKRAASLPRMEGGRRPRMHTEAVSEGEKVQDSRDQTPDIDTPPPESVEPEAPPVEVDAQIQEPPVEENMEAEEAEEVAAARPSSRSGRRSRSRRRSSRGSKDLKAMKTRNMQTPTPTHGDSSPELGVIGLSPVDAPSDTSFSNTICQPFVANAFAQVAHSQ